MWRIRKEKAATSRLSFVICSFSALIILISVFLAVIVCPVDASLLGEGVKFADLDSEVCEFGCCPTVLTLYSLYSDT
jgi:hypothetical protein